MRERKYCSCGKVVAVNAATQHAEAHALRAETAEFISLDDFLALHGAIPNKRCSVSRGARRCLLDEHGANVLHKVVRTKTEERRGLGSDDGFLYW